MDFTAPNGADSGIPGAPNDSDKSEALTSQVGATPLTIRRGRRNGMPAGGKASANAITPIAGFSTVFHCPGGPCDSAAPPDSALGAAGRKTGGNAGGNDGADPSDAACAPAGPGGGEKTGAISASAGRGNTGAVNAS